MQNSMDLSANLKKLLRERDTSAAQLSRATKVPVQTIANWLNSQKPRDIDQVKRVADHFGVTVDSICFGEMSQNKKETNAIKNYDDEILAGIYEVVLRRVKKSKS